MSRSLTDFVKLVDVFERNSVTFVSVTQSFCTTTSMGRLTLNILLAFVQFERELTGERIRDKFAASRRKGIFMVGIPPLGYDVRDRKLVVNQAEAELVRLIFRRFLDLGSALLLIRELNPRVTGPSPGPRRPVPSARAGQWFGSGAVSRPKTLFVQAAWARPATFALVDTYQLW